MTNNIWLIWFEVHVNPLSSLLWKGHNNGWCSHSRVYRKYEWANYTQNLGSVQFILCHVQAGFIKQDKHLLFCIDYTDYR